MNPDLEKKLQPSIDAFKHGGKREGAGPKTLPEGEHKEQIVIGLEQDYIIEWGGKKKLQNDIKTWFYRQLKKLNNQKH